MVNIEAIYIVGLKGGVEVLCVAGAAIGPDGHGSALDPAIAQLVEEGEGRPAALHVR